MEGQALLTPTIASLVVADAIDPWRAAGFTVGDDGRCHIGSVCVHLVGTASGKGILAWALHGLEGTPTALDGVDTVPAADRTIPPPEGGAHPNGASVIDHVVMTTPAPERTIAALEAAGMTHRRTREPDNYDQPMRQDFFRMGEVILELIGPRSPDPDQGHRPARLYGLAHTVDDLDATVALLGDLVNAPKDAVQSGRRIATLRTRDLGISVPTAFMSSALP